MFVFLQSVVFFCFKQKTAYEMRMSDWSSDVCSSDLGLVVAAMAADDGGAGLVQADHLDVCALVAEAQHHAVERGHRRDIPEMRLADVDDHALQRLKQIEGTGKGIGRGTEDLALNAVAIGRASCRERVCQTV